MKTCYRILAAALALLLLSCQEKVKPDIPAPKPPEEETPVTPVKPDEPEQPAADYPVDVQKAFQEAHLIQTVKSCNHALIHSGVDMTEIRYTDYDGKPQAVFVMQVDLADNSVSMTNTVPGNATTGFTAGRQRLTAQFKLIDTPGHWVIGGINTDFFTTEAGANAGRAQGIFWHNGICLKNTFNSQATRPRCFVYWGDDEVVHMAKSADYNAIRSSVTLKEAFSGGQFLVEKGAATQYVEDSVFGVHPRTMFGVTADPKKVVLVVLDGRDNTLAVGMNYPDMQTILLALGCETALNIDGGGSSTFAIRNNAATGYGSGASFQVRNKPSDGSERAIGPGLAILGSD